MTQPTSPVIVPPADLERLFGMSTEDAARASELTQLVIESYLYPNAVPDPVPTPVYTVGLALAVRFGGAKTTTGGALTSESIGSYSYRVAMPLTYDDVLTMMSEFALQLAPWAPAGKQPALDVYIGGVDGDLPLDYWQRDLEQPADDLPRIAIEELRG